MATYTGDSIDKLRKQDLIPIVLTLQSKLEDKDNTVLEELRKLNESVSQLRLELAVTRNANNLLLTGLTTLERQCGQVPNIQDVNVLISWAFLTKFLEKFWRRKF